MTKRVTFSVYTLYFNNRSPALEADTLPSEPPGNVYNVRLLVSS